MFRYVFGPVTSGRLGRSLGLDLLGDRICSMDCVYCEVGRTTDLTMERSPLVPAETILEELAAWIGEGHTPPDVVTLGGEGEPCLNTRMGDVIEGVTALMPDTPVAVLTNATLLGLEEVRRELALADVVLPSLDSLVEEELRKVNRPHGGISIEGLVQGLLDFRACHAGRMFLEILLVAGINDTEENLARLTEFLPRLSPDRVDVVTMTRPGTLPTARAVDTTTLKRWRSALKGEPARKASTPPRTASRPVFQAARVREAVLASLKRRPQSAEQLAQALEVDESAVRTALEDLVKDRFVETLNNGFHRVRQGN